MLDDLRLGQPDPVSVPAEGQADLATGFYHATRGWVDAQRAPIRSLLGSVNLACA